MAGGVISHYELQSKLGQGGMGIVYRAIDTRLGRVVALKMIPREALGRDDLRKRMLREARAAAMLNHPNVCALYDVDDSLGFLVLECIDGASLSDVLKRGLLEPSEALNIARQIAEGLAAAHDRNIIDRDVKPANILLTSAG
jgi:eukaryotic-like serine/threonine-protein kinase